MLNSLKKLLVLETWMTKSLANETGQNETPGKQQTKTQNVFWGRDCQLPPSIQFPHLQ